jgi:hypothetical protein
MLNHIRTVLVGLLALAAAPAAAEEGFKPGWIYISASSNKGLVSGDLIWAFDPATGNSELLADVGQSGTSDLLFTPDGTRLLDAMFVPDRIGAITPAGTVEPYLGPADGLNNPWAMTYDPAGNLFVIGTDAKVLRFPADGGPGEVFADAADGIGGRGPLAASPQGDLYYAQIETSPNIIRVTPDGVGSVFATLDQGIVSLCTDSAGNLFIQGTGDLFRIDAGDPTTLRVLNSAGGTQFTNIRLSEDEAFLYYQFGALIYRFDALTGSGTYLGQIPSTPDHYEGTGMAVYVPEPGFFVAAIPFALWLARSRARRPVHLCTWGVSHDHALCTRWGADSPAAGEPGCSKTVRPGPERCRAVVEPGANQAVWLSEGDRCHP